IPRLFFATAIPRTLYQTNRGHPMAPQNLAFNPGRAWLRLRILQVCIKQMVLPDAVDAKILPGIALAHEAGIFQEPDGAIVGGNARRFKAVQPQRCEREGKDGPHRRGHVAAAPERQAHPVAETARLRDAAADIGEGQAADKSIVGAADDEKSVPLVLPQILRIALDPAPERAAGEIVVRPR